jgi:hypothetical protein
MRSRTPSSHKIAGPVVSVERRQPADAEQLFGLYRQVFGKELEEGSRRRWSWQYLQNPTDAGAGPEIWVAREGERLLGQYASMPVRLLWGGREVRASWGMDVFLREEARGRGIGATLFSTWSDSVEVALGLGLTASSYGLFKKLRYQDVGPVAFFQKVLDPVAVMARRVGRALARPAGALLGVGLALIRPERGGPPAVATRRITAFSAEYDTLWERCQGAYAMCVRRDQAYLNWKYVACPGKTYEISEARREGVLTGYLVARHQEQRGLRLGWLVDVFALPDDHATKDALIAGALTSFRAAGVARAQAFAMNRSLAGDLRRRGFFAGRSPMQFCVRAQLESGSVFRDRGRWHVCFGDSDMDR